MSQQVTIQGTSYNLPQAGDSPPWGDNLSNLLQALVNVANTVIGSSDILNTSFTVNNNVSSASNITGLSLDPTTVRSAMIQYSIYRSSSTPTELSECGVILATYKTTASTWEFSQYATGNAGITITLLSSGQFQYTSTNIGSGSYVGKMKFSAKTFLQS